MRDTSIAGRAELTGMELARQVVPPDFKPNPPRNPDIDATRYFALIDDYGSPAFTPDEVLALPEGYRQAADKTLRFAEGVFIVPVATLERGTAPLQAEAATGGQLSRDGNCLKMVTSPTVSAPATVDVAIPPEGLALGIGAGPPAELRLRRFGEDYAAEVVGTLAGGLAGEVRPPRDAFPRPWHARISGVRTFTLCTATPAA